MSIKEPVSFADSLPSLNGSGGYEMDNPKGWKVLSTVARTSKCAILNVVINDEKFVVKQYFKKPLKRECLKRQKQWGRLISEYDIIKEEYDLMKELEHERIIGVDSIVDFGINVYLVLEFGGDELAPDNLEDQTKYDLEDVMIWVNQITEGLEFIHNKKVVHGDLKPSNLLRSQNNNIKICDFGSSVREYNDNDTLSKIPKGTPAYNSPEFCEASSGASSCSLIHGKPLDMWALGATIYRLLYGKVPFYCEGTIFQLYDSIMNDDIIIPDEVLTKSGFITVLPTQVRDILEGLLERDPVKRLTIGQLKDKLQKIVL
ncbi:unnamed protein product [Wickerhamomyces anomalus]